MVHAAPPVPLFCQSLCRQPLKPNQIRHRRRAEVVSPVSFREHGAGEDAAVRPDVLDDRHVRAGLVAARRVVGAESVLERLQVLVRQRV